MVTQHACEAVQSFAPLMVRQATILSLGSLPGAESLRKLPL